MINRSVMASFVERTEELSAIADWSLNATGPCVIRGMGGVGKTTIAAVYAERSKGQYEVEVLVAAREMSPVDEAISRIAARLPRRGVSLLVVDGIDEHPDPDLLSSSLLELSAARPDARVLLITRSVPSTLGKANPCIVTVPPTLSEAQMRDFVRRRLLPSAFQAALGTIGASLPRLFGIPVVLDALSDLVSSRGDPTEATTQLLADLRRPLAGLVLRYREGSFEPVPVAALPPQAIATPTGAALNAVPYIHLPMVGIYWRNRLDQFEAIINDPDVDEADIQGFFEKNPEFLQGVDYRGILPHPVLERADDENLIPDFFLLPLSVNHADILELKLPTEKVYVGRENRLHFSASVHEALAQVREYRDYFEAPERRRMVRDKYGLTAYRPAVSVVIGKMPQNVEYEKAAQIDDTLPRFADVVTYDQLLGKMQRVAQLRSR